MTGTEKATPHPSLLEADTLSIKFGPEARTGRSNLIDIPHLSHFKRLEPNFNQEPIKYKGPLPPISQFENSNSSIFNSFIKGGCLSLMEGDDSSTEKKHLLPKDKSSQTMIVRCSELIRTGRLWDIYKAEITIENEPNVTVPIVLKILVPSQLQPFITPLEWEGPLGLRYLSGHSRETGIKAAWNEDYLFRNQLKQYQDDLVPIYYGTFVWYNPEYERDVDSPYAIVQIQEYVGPQIQAINMDIYSFSKEIRVHIYNLHISLNKDLHIIHRSLHKDHILVRKTHDDGMMDISIIDFQNAIIWNPHSIGGLEWISGKDKKLLWEDSDHACGLTGCLYDENEKKWHFWLEG